MPRPSQPFTNSLGLVDSAASAMKNNGARRLTRKQILGKDSVYRLSDCLRFATIARWGRRGGASIQRKLEAFAGSLLPSHCAILGKAHSGRSKRGFPFDSCFAGMLSGIMVPMTHRSSAPIASNVVAPGPPAQCPIPGTMNSRTETSVSGPNDCFTRS